MVLGVHTLVCAKQSKYVPTNNTLHWLGRDACMSWSRMVAVPSTASSLTASYSQKTCRVLGFTSGRAMLIENMPTGCMFKIPWPSSLEPLRAIHCPPRRCFLAKDEQNTRRDVQARCPVLNLLPQAQWASPSPFGWVLCACTLKPVARRSQWKKTVTNECELFRPCL